MSKTQKQKRVSDDSQYPNKKQKITQNVLSTSLERKVELSHTNLESKVNPRRIRTLYGSINKISDGPIIYWMSRDQVFFLLVQILISLVLVSLLSTYVFE
jgi:hypothetical protein